MKQTGVRFLWRENGLARQFRTGVCLHSHTMHSRESVRCIPRWAAAFPPLAWEIGRQARKYRAKYNRDLDYARGFWTPPLPAANALELEEHSIQQELGLPALVSLTDHDNIEAAGHLQAQAVVRAAAVTERVPRCVPVPGGSPGGPLPYGRGSDGILREARHTPISMEWSVPFGPSYFHIGVHNLPAGQAQAIVEELNRFTQDPSSGLRNELLAGLAVPPETLVVLNHPLWDQGDAGAEGHFELLRGLLASSGEFIHALELNGLRCWQENQKVIQLAGELGFPLVSGGDRHGCEPAAALNLTRASCFAEFACEIRAGASEIVILPHYRDPVRYRLLKSIFDIMRDYPELPGRERWMDRFFCYRYTGCTSSLSEICNGNVPGVVRYFERAIRVTGNRAFQQMLRFYFADSAKPENWQVF